MKFSVSDSNFVNSKLLPYCSDEDSDLILKCIKLNKQLGLYKKLVTQPWNLKVYKASPEHENVEIAADFIDLCNQASVNKQKTSDWNNKIDSLKKMIIKIETDQERLRNNIKSLENVKSDNLIQR